MENEKRRNYVLDSSIAVKWFVDEEDSNKARLLKDRFVAGELEIAAPNLLKYEVANALRWHPIAHIDGRSLARALITIDDYQFLVDPPEEAWNRAIELSYLSRISPYDGIYLGLAHTLSSRLLTADQNLIAAVPSSERAIIASLARLVLE